jgi:lipoprotein-anchoring transpeptidase ErfK/SrfK
MRLRTVAGLALALLAMASPVQAGKVKFSAQAFTVFGGMDNGSTTASLPVSYNSSDVPDGLRSRTVSFSSMLPAGSILVRTRERMLYYILPGGKAIAYHVGVGREGYTWSGTNTVSRKAEWPDWHPPREMILREAKRGKTIPDFMEGGPGNPLGARAIYIGTTEFRIHGTTQPWSIGKAVSSGCIRLLNEEVIDLYDRVAVGAKVVVED